MQEQDKLLSQLPVKINYSENLVVKKLYKDLILVLIYKSGGMFTWYQIEIALDLRGIGGKSNSVGIIEGLIQEGFVEPKHDDEKNLYHYLVTDEGKIKSLQLIDTFGNDAFSPTEQNPNDYE